MKGFCCFSIKRQRTLNTVLVCHAAHLYSQALFSLFARKIIQDMTACTANAKVRNIASSITLRENIPNVVTTFGN